MNVHRKTGYMEGSRVGRPQTERNHMATTYELFYMPTCPYCRKVLAFMQTQDIELPLRDITAEPQARETLETVGGKVQVPCLFIDGKPMYESDDIIDYLAQNVAQ